MSHSPEAAGDRALGLEWEVLVCSPSPTLTSYVALGMLHSLFEPPLLL